MTMIVALLFSLASCGLAWAANTWLRGERRLPMQWWFDGSVTWTAPRVVALAFIPVLAALMFLSLVLVSLNVRPRAGQEGDVLPVFVIVGIMLIAIQLLHLWLIGRTLGRNGR